MLCPVGVPVAKFQTQTTSTAVTLAISFFHFLWWLFTIVPLNSQAT